jgi:DNA-binding transcriptional LysR family regulator
MNVVDLRTFEAVARHGSMSKAAAELCTVQSNVTARIKAMETEVGRQLFYRHAQGVTTTPAAERIRPLIARITGLMEEIQSSARETGTPGGQLVIGAPEATTALRLSPLLKEFKDTWTDVHIVVTPGTTTELLNGVLDWRLEGAIVVGPLEHDDIHKELLFTEELVLVSSPNVQSIEQVTKLKEPKAIVFGRGCPYRTQIDSLLRTMGISADEIEFGSLDTIISCVSAGVGVAILPRAVLASATRNRLVTAHRLPRDLAIVETSFIRRREGYQSSALVAFLELARRNCSS